MPVKINKQVEERVRLRDSIIIPADSLFRYRQQIKVDFDS